MSSKQATCSERISDHLASREEMLDDIFNALDNDEEHDEYGDPLDFLYSGFPLSIDKITIMKVQLSTGGPGDWIEVYMYDDSEIQKVTYHFNDWFDHASMTVPEDSSMYRYAEMLVEALYRS
jgi:hypothetical protein